VFIIYVAKCKDIVQFLPHALDNFRHYHTIEGRKVTFSYGCYGTNVFNRWGVDKHPLSEYPPPNSFDFDETNSSVGCVNTFTLTLYHVKLNYTRYYTAYPSKSNEFSTTGINSTVHLSEYKYLHNNSLST